MERTEEEGERAARPYVRSVSGNPKEKRGKKLILRKKCLCLDGRGEQKIPGKTRRRPFFFIQLTGPKAFYRPQQNRGRIVVCSTQRQAVCSLYIEDALPSTSRCTCRLNNVHTCQQIANYSHMLFFPFLPSFLPSFHPRPPRKQFRSPNISTSRLAACCGVTSGGTGTFMQDSEAPVTTLPCHMEWRHILVLPMHVNERLH
jgi:hypothetical protein